MAQLGFILAVHTTHLPRYKISYHLLNLGDPESRYLVTRTFALDMLSALEAASPQETKSFLPAGVFVGIICGWTRHRRGSEAALAIACAERSYVFTVLESLFAVLGGRAGGTSAMWARGEGQGQHGERQEQKAGGSVVSSPRATQIQSVG